MLNRSVEGTRKFRKAETPNLAKSRAKRVGGNVALPSQPEKVTGSDAEERSGTLGVYEWFEVRHPYLILRSAVAPADWGEKKLVLHRTVTNCIPARG
jgi:hypothetical protein